MGPIFEEVSIPETTHRTAIAEGRLRFDLNIRQQYCYCSPRPRSLEEVGSVVSLSEQNGLILEALLFDLQLEIETPVTGPPERSSHILKRRKPSVNRGLSNINSRRRPTLPHSLPCSTIGAEELNCRVRNGNGCCLLAIITGKIYKFSATNSNQSDRIRRLRSPKTGELKLIGQAERPISTG